MKFNIAQSERGWEVTYDGVFGPEDDTKFFSTERKARDQCQREAARAAEWYMHLRADAHHLNAF